MATKTWALVERLQMIADPRRQCENLRPPLVAVSMLGFGGVLAGCEDCVEIAEWATAHQEVLGAFLESVLSASLIVLVIRSRRPFFKSQPGKYLLLATLLSAGVTLIFPYIPARKIFGFQALPVSILLVLGGIVGVYMLTAEVTKSIFYKSGLGR